MYCTDWEAARAMSCHRGLRLSCHHSTHHTPNSPLSLASNPEVIYPAKSTGSMIKAEAMGEERVGTFLHRSEPASRSWNSSPL